MPGLSSLWIAFAIHPYAVALQLDTFQLNAPAKPLSSIAVQFTTLQFMAFTFPCAAVLVYSLRYQYSANLIMSIPLRRLS